ncbi:restriction endonuclease subunit S [Streptomyces niveus]|uniref:restriction endonuclease subunit S n=1 Tax=Streptomyces niveus TaxID=193462 RepID=UPI00386E80A1
MRDGWKRVALGEVTHEESVRVGELADEAIVLSSTKHHGLVRSDEYFKNRQIYSDDISGYKLVRRGWFAYATNHLAEGSIGLQELVDVACVSPIYTVFSCSPEIDVSFMYRILKSDAMLAEYGVHDQASVDRRGAVRYRDFKEIEINLPPLGEQKQIAEILDEVQNQLRTVEASAEKESASLHAAMTGRLSDPKHPRRSLRTLLKKRPKNGFSPTEVDGWTGFLALGLGCLTPAGFVARQLKPVAREVAAGNQATLSDGDVLVSRANTRELVGLAGIYRDVGVTCIYPDLMMRLTPRDGISAEFLEIAIGLPESRRHIQALSQGTSESMVKITGDVIWNLEVPFPEAEELNEILGLKRAAQMRWKLHTDTVDKLLKYKRALADDLLTGRTHGSAHA